MKRRVMQADLYRVRKIMLILSSSKLDELFEFANMMSVSGCEVKLFASRQAFVYLISFIKSLELFVF